jgi:hypothetical protein
VLFCVQLCKFLFFESERERWIKLCVFVCTKMFLFDNSTKRVEVRARERETLTIENNARLLVKKLLFSSIIFLVDVECHRFSRIIDWLIIITARLFDYSIKRRLRMSLRGAAKKPLSKVIYFCVFDMLPSKRRTRRELINHTRRQNSWANSNTSRTK